MNEPMSLGSPIMPDILRRPNSIPPAENWYIPLAMIDRLLNTSVSSSSRMLRSFSMKTMAMAKIMRVLK